MRTAVSPVAVLVPLLAAAVWPVSCYCASGIIGETAGFSTQIVAQLAPGQPYDAFFGECPSLVHRGGTTWFVYADPYFDICIKAWDHDTQTLSSATLVGEGWNDHLRPALLMDHDGYLHVLYSARPMPLRYHGSTAPLDHTAWSAYEQVGTSATYPVPYILGDRLLVIYREGDSYCASLSCAVRDLSMPIGTPGAWTITQLVGESSVFVPMPLAAFELDGSVCFLFNMRDALLSSPHVPIAPSVREGMAVARTVDGISFTALDGSPLDLPLDYSRDREGFPEVTRHEEYVRRTLYGSGDRSGTGELGYDGSFVEFTLTPSAYDRTEILIGDSTMYSCRVELTAGGHIVLSDGAAPVPVSTYTPGATYALRLKFHFSAGFYRPMLDGVIDDDLLGIAVTGPPPSGGYSMDSVSVLDHGDCGIELLSGREYKLMTASACPDIGGETNIFFIDRMDSSERSRWRLMHQRGGTVAEIGDPDCHQYHPSSIRLGDLVLVAVAYFDGDGLFLDNDHLDESSRIMLLGSTDLQHWQEIELAAGSGGHVHPIFKRDDGSGLVELKWARIDSETSTALMHACSGFPTGASPDPARGIVLHGLPNPFSSTATIRFVLDVPRTVDVGIYDPAGRRVRRLLEGVPMTAGGHDIHWDGRNDAGAPVVPGVYFVRAGSGALARSAKIVLIR